MNSLKNGDTGIGRGEEGKKEGKWVGQKEG